VKKSAPSPWYATIFLPPWTGEIPSCTLDVIRRQLRGRKEINITFAGEDSGLPGEARRRSIA